MEWPAHLPLVGGGGVSHSCSNVYKYMVLCDFHSPSMKEEQLREKTKLYLLLNHPILSYPAKFLLLNSLLGFFLLFSSSRFTISRDLFV